MVFDDRQRQYIMKLLLLLRRRIKLISSLRATTESLKYWLVLQTILHSQKKNTKRTLSGWLCSFTAFHLQVESLPVPSPLLVTGSLRNSVMRSHPSCCWDFLSPESRWSDGEERYRRSSIPLVDGCFLLLIYHHSAPVCSEELRRGSHTLFDRLTDRMIDWLIDWLGLADCCWSINYTHSHKRKWGGVRQLLPCVYCLSLWLVNSRPSAVIIFDGLRGGFSVWPSSSSDKTLLFFRSTVSRCYCVVCCWFRWSSDPSLQLTPCRAVSFWGIQFRSAIVSWTTFSQFFFSTGFDECTFTSHHLHSGTTSAK